MTLFPPTLEEARARIATVNPAEYSRNRNALNGAVTQLSPYITHGFISLPEVLEGVRLHHSVRT
jgi:deoxyribodipyrimidine photo-lyase